MTNQLTQAELLNIAKQAGFEERMPGTYGDYIATEDDICKFAQLIQQQGEPVYQVFGEEGWLTTNEHIWSQYPETHRQKLYTQPQLVAQALEKAAQILEIELGMSECSDMIIGQIRALIDQPVEHIVDANKMVEQGGDELCTWEQDEETPSMYTTQCGQEYHFIEGDAQENGINFCYHCGKKVRQALTNRREA